MENTSKIESIKYLAEKVLSEKGEKKEDSHYYPEISIGGDFTGHYVDRKFRNKTILITDWKETFDDGSGNYSLRIFQRKRGIINGILYALDLDDGEIMFHLDDNKLEVFREGDWEKNLESLVQKQTKCQ